MLTKKLGQTLVILAPGFPANEADSTCLPTQQALVRNINKNYPALSVIILAFEYPFIRGSYKWHNNTVISFNGWNKGKIKKLLIRVAVWRALYKIKKENNIIGLFSFWCGEGALHGSYFGKLNGIKHYCWISGQDAKKQNKLVQWMKLKPGELVAMSDFLASEFYKNHKLKPFHIIPNAIDEKMFARGNLYERDIDILGAGSLIPLKQYDIFIGAVDAIRQQLPAVKTLLCGEGIEAKKLEALRMGLHMQENILLTGKIPHNAVLQLMQRTKIFLHTSAYEGLSTVCLEALYAGAHVISFCKPMEVEIKHWHIVNNKEEILQLVLNILQDPATDYSPVLPYSMDSSAKAVVGLFQ